MSVITKVMAPAPLFRDPIYDGPTDPTIIWHKGEEQWYLFYTQRRSSDASLGVSWVHGTKIGVATSKDGAKWLYRGTLEGLDIEWGHNTFWAPEVIYALGEYHMYVSYITGIPTDWQYPRQMLHYTSQDLKNWEFKGEVVLSSNRVIDACVYEVEPGLFKMWYKDENHNSHTYAAVSRNLYDWEVIGPEVTDCGQEGPNVFEFGGKKWMISDYWNGLAVYRTEDFTNWDRCADILKESGNRKMDAGEGHHADVLVCRDGDQERAYIIYFCHPGIDPAEVEAGIGPTMTQRNRSAVQVAELKIENDQIVCDRNAEVELWLVGEV